MPNLSLGTIEVLGLPAAVEAADVALKSADVSLIGYETTDGMGMVAVKIEGQVAAVQSAVAAAGAAASRISKVFATSVIARPSVQLDPVVRTDVTVGLARPPAPSPAPPPVEPVEPVETPPAPPSPDPDPDPDPPTELSESHGAIAQPDSDKSEEGGVPKPRTRKPSTSRTKK